MNDDRALVEAALAGDVAATRRLVHAVMPVIQARIARALMRRRARSNRDARQEVEDLAQDVFATLFADHGRVLRAWDPTRGLGLPGFCGLIAEREAASILRSGRRSPWTEDATELEDLERDLPVERGVETRIATREQLDILVERVRETLSPRGLEMFERLIVAEEAVESVCAATGMTPDAVYAWKSRLGKLIRKIGAEIASSEPRQPLSETKEQPRSTGQETP